MNPYGYCEGTVKPFPNFDPKEDAKNLKMALEASGVNEKGIINILAKRSNSQRGKIANSFKLLYGEDLTDRLKYKLCGDFENVMIALMKPLDEYLASEVYYAITGVGTDEDALIEILCTRTNSEILYIKEAYRRLYSEDMGDAIKNDTAGHFQRLLVSICSGARNEFAVDKNKAKENAEALISNGFDQSSFEDFFCVSLLANESFQQLAETFTEFEKLAGHSITEAIEREVSGDVKNAMIAIVHCAENRQLYFAEKLYMAMKGLGTDDGTLIRIIISRCEIDMVQIKKEYELRYDKPLAEAIIEDTSGDYRRVLTILVDGY